MIPNDGLKKFVFDAMLMKASLDSLQDSGVTVTERSVEHISDSAERLAFANSLIASGIQMAKVFVVFFCIENSVRELVTQRLQEKHGTNWWSRVPQKVQSKVDELRQKEEITRYHTKRSSELIGYTMFGHLKDIIIAQWADFADVFPTQAWVSSRFDDLEKSRNIIMHTGILPDSEIQRIEMIARDWVNQVG